MTTERTSDRVQIQATMALYCHCVDSGDATGVASAFTADARLVLSSGTTVQGKQDVFALYERVIGAGRPDRAADGSIPLLRHNLTTSRIEFDDADSAHGWTYFLSWSRFGPDHSGQYVDRFRRVAGRWLIADRRIDVEWHASPSWYEQVRLKAAAAR